MAKRVLKVGLVGGGGGAFIVNPHQKAIHFDGTRRVVCGALHPDPKVAMSEARKWPYKLKGYPSYDEMIADQAKLPIGERIDYALIVTPNFVHFDPAMKLVEAGIPVMCEKPLTITAAQAIELPKAVKKRRVPLGVAQTYLGHCSSRVSYWFVTSGKLGAAGLDETRWVTSAAFQGTPGLACKRGVRSVPEIQDRPSYHRVVGDRAEPAVGFWDFGRPNEGLNFVGRRQCIKDVNGGAPGACQAPAAGPFTEAIDPAGKTQERRGRSLERQAPRICFVAMPFDKWHDRYFATIYGPAAERAGFRPIRADGLLQIGQLISQIKQLIRKADVVLAELSGTNANVAYEVGFADANGKPVILVTGNMEDVPFDLRHHRVLVYDVREPGWAGKLRRDIRTLLRSARSDPSALRSNPAEV